MDAILTLQEKRLLRVDEAAKILNVSRWTVYRWVEAGRLGGTRLQIVAADLGRALANPGSSAWRTQ